MKRGDVWWYEEPDEAPRAWLILTRDEAIGRLDKLLAAPVSRTIRGISTEVRLGCEDGMPIECAVSLDNTTPILKALLIHHVTTVGPAKMSQVCQALATATSC